VPSSTSDVGSGTVAGGVFSGVAVPKASKFLGSATQSGVHRPAAGQSRVKIWTDHVISNVPDEAAVMKSAPVGCVVMPSAPVSVSEN